jgi:hypothetical protein
VYKDRFPDGRTEELAANVIAEPVYAQCDANKNQYILLDAIIDYRKDPSVAMARDNQVSIVDGKKIVKRSTRGWELCCEWKDGSTSWQKLPDLKESHPLQVAEFALQIADEPAFNWWVSWVLKKRDSAEALDTTIVSTTTGLKFPRLWRRLTQSIRPFILPFGVMRLRRR